MENTEMNTQNLSRGAQVFKDAQNAWKSKNENQNLQKPQPKSKQQTQQTQEQQEPQTQEQQEPQTQEQQKNPKDEYDSLCRQYDKCYHTLYAEARKLARILETKAKNPVIEPKFLKAWDNFDYTSKSPVVTAVNKKYDWKWKKINRPSPFEAVFEKMKNNGYWLKSGLFYDNTGDYFELTVGFSV
jgi:hypothetical protein